MYQDLHRRLALFWCWGFPCRLGPASQTPLETQTESYLCKRNWTLTLHKGGVISGSYKHKCGLRSLQSEAPVSIPERRFLKNFINTRLYPACQSEDIQAICKCWVFTLCNSICSTKIWTEEWENGWLTISVSNPLKFLCGSGTGIQKMSLRIQGGKH